MTKSKLSNELKSNLFPSRDIRHTSPVHFNYLFSVTVISYISLIERILSLVRSQRPFTDHPVHLHQSAIWEEEFADTKGVIRIRISKKNR